MHETLEKLQVLLEGPDDLDVGSCLPVTPYCLPGCRMSSPELLAQVAAVNAFIHTSTINNMSMLNVSAKEAKASRSTLRPPFPLRPQDPCEAVDPLHRQGRAVAVLGVRAPRALDSNQSSRRSSSPRGDPRPSERRRRSVVGWSVLGRVRRWELGR